MGFGTASFLLLFAAGLNGGENYRRFYSTAAEVFQWYDQVYTDLLSEVRCLSRLQKKQQQKT